MATATPKFSGAIVFKNPDFVFFHLSRWFVVCATEMQSVALGWQIYAVTGRPLALGLVGLCQFLPGLLLFLVTGHAADRFNRRNLLILCFVGFGTCSALLLTATMHGLRSVAPLYAVICLVGVVRAFYGPSSRAVLPQLVPEEQLQNAVAWSGTIFQSATILGPSIGGFIYAATGGPSAVYSVAVISAVVSIICMSQLKADTKIRAKETMSLSRVFAGLQYIWREKLILGSISLDLFAVLLGGATALLPAFAVMLNAGPRGLGLLRGAPGVGAAAMAIVIAYQPLERRAGQTMLWCVAGFGVCTILFGLSHSLVLSLLALFLCGATDMVSVIVRGTLVQVATPNEMRGRVSAVDMIFIGASNELGGFESGATAQAFGTVPAVVIGGIGTLLVAGLWAWIFPQIRNADQLTLSGEN
jgi:MFS family permease